MPHKGAVVSHPIRSQACVGKSRDRSILRFVEGAHHADLPKSYAGSGERLTACVELAQHHHFAFAVSFNALDAGQEHALAQGLAIDSKKISGFPAEVNLTQD